jgi:hypothetical protein
MTTVTSGRNGGASGGILRARLSSRRRAAIAKPTSISRRRIDSAVKTMSAMAKAVKAQSEPCWMSTSRVPVSRWLPVTGTSALGSLSASVTVVKW